MTTKSTPLLLSLLALIASLALASDPNPLQDFVSQTNQAKVAISCTSLLHAVFANGKVCKDPKLAQANDFFFSGLDKPGNMTNPMGSKVTLVNVAQLAGLSTLGISMVRVDYAPGGQNPPHTHPRATEILMILEGSLYIGFVTSYQRDSSKGRCVCFPSWPHPFLTECGL
ncbi:hypothetical protein AMTRI_Chr07g74960 [Amborella trichopoda]